MANSDETAEAEQTSGEAKGTRVEEARLKAEFIFSRAAGLFVQPDTEWDEIRREKTNVASIMIGYVVPLAAIMPICDFLGKLIFGGMLLPAIGQSLVDSVVMFVVTIVVIFLLGFMINAASEHFDADRDDLAAQKVAAYSLTPFQLSGILYLWPPLWWLSIFAIGYSVFLLYRGLPALMKAPEDRVISYTVTVAVSALVSFIVLSGIAFAIT